MSSNWQHQLEKIADRAKNILQTGLWADCTFLVGIGDHRKEFKAHKLILSMSSAVFDKMLNGPLQENPNSIEVVDIQPEAFAALLKYIYTDEIQIQSFDQACELCYVANKYMMPILVQHCISYIWKDINYTNACRAYEFAKLFDQHGITEDCKKIMFSQTSEIIEHQSFRDIEKNTLFMILDEDELNIESEIQLFRAVENWIEAEFERKGLSSEEEKQTLYNEVISKIRFLSMNPQEFAEGPAVSPYISKDDSYAILINLVSPSPPIRLPKNFSEKKRTIGNGQKSTDDGRREFCWELKYPAEMEVTANTE